MKTLQIFVFLFLGLFLSHSTVLAQAWTQEQGAMYLKTSYGLAWASHQFNFDGQLKQYSEGLDENTFKSQSIMTYMEVGILNELTFSVSAPFQMISIRDQTFLYETSGWADIVLGLRLDLKRLFRISLSSFAFALNVQSAIPTGYTRNFTPSLGLGMSDLRGMLNVGYSFYPLPIYIQGGVGYRYRIPVQFATQVKACKSSDIDCFIEGTNPPETHEMRFVIEAGFSIQKWALIQLLGDAIVSINAPKVAFSISNPLPADQRVVKAGAAITFYPFYMFQHAKKIGISVQTMFALYGENSIRSLELFFGLEYGINFAKLAQKK